MARRRHPIPAGLGTVQSGAAVRGARSQLHVARALRPRAPTHRGPKSAQASKGTGGVQEKRLRVKVIMRGSVGRDQKRPTGTAPGLRLSNEQLAQCSLDPFAGHRRRRRAEPAGGMPHVPAENASQGWNNDHIRLHNPALVPCLN